MDGCYWVPSSASSGAVPAHAIQGGVDADGSPIYVGRARHNGDLIPAKVIPKHRVAYVAYGGKEKPAHSYEVLCRSQLEWVPCENGHVPIDAVEGGRTITGEKLYIGRARFQRSQTVGKIHRSHNCCYISFGGNEISCRQYEVLVIQR